MLAVVHIALLLAVLSKNRFVNCQLICANEASRFDEKKICFDLDKGRFINPKIGRNSIYDAEVTLKQHEIALGRSRRKPRACRGYNFYRRCQRKYGTHLGRLECRYARCSVCITEHLHPGCPFCYADKSVFCPAVESCSCPWKAGYGIWDSCRRQINSRCYVPQEEGIWAGREGASQNNSTQFSTFGFRAYVNNASSGQGAAHASLYRLSKWTLFEWVISLQATVVMLNILSALVLSIVEYLSPWPMILMAILLLIPIFPTLCSNQYEENLKLFGWTQLICGFVELFWSSCVLLDMNYHSNDWRAYFIMCTVSWQFISVILISTECPLLERMITGRRNGTNVENRAITDPSSCSVDLRIAQLRTALNFEKQRLDERKKRQKERLKRNELTKHSKVFTDSATQSEEIDARTAREISDQTVDKMTDLKTAKMRQDDKVSDMPKI